MKETKASVKIRAKCFKCNKTWVMLKLKKANVEKLKEFSLPEKIECIHCGHENSQSELKLQKTQR